MKQRTAKKTTDRMDTVTVYYKLTASVKHTE